MSAIPPSQTSTILAEPPQTNLSDDIKSIIDQYVAQRSPLAGSRNMLLAAVSLEQNGNEDEQDDDQEDDDQHDGDTTDALDSPEELEYGDDPLEDEEEDEDDGDSPEPPQRALGIKIQPGMQAQKQMLLREQAFLPGIGRKDQPEDALVLKENQEILKEPLSAEVTVKLHQSNDPDTDPQPAGVYRMLLSDAVAVGESAADEEGGKGFTVKFVKVSEDYNNRFSSMKSRVSQGVWECLPLEQVSHTIQEANPEQEFECKSQDCTAVFVQKYRCFGWYRKDKGVVQVLEFTDPWQWRMVGGLLLKAGLVGMNTSLGHLRPLAEENLELHIEILVDCDETRMDLTGDAFKWGLMTSVAPWQQVEQIYNAAMDSHNIDALAKVGGLFGCILDQYNIHLTFRMLEFAHRSLFGTLIYSPRSNSNKPQLIDLLDSASVTPSWISGASPKLQRAIVMKLRTQFLLKVALARPEELIEPCHGRFERELIEAANLDVLESVLSEGHLKSLLTNKEQGVLAAKIIKEFELMSTQVNFESPASRFTIAFKSCGFGTLCCDILGETALTDAQSPDLMLALCQILVILVRVDPQAGIPGLRNVPLAKLAHHAVFYGESLLASLKDLMVLKIPKEAINSPRIPLLQKFAKEGIFTHILNQITEVQDKEVFQKQAFENLMHLIGFLIPYFDVNKMLTPLNNEGVVRRVGTFMKRLDANYTCKHLQAQYLDLLKEVVRVKHVSFAEGISEGIEYVFASLKADPKAMGALQSKLCAFLNELMIFQPTLSSKLIAANRELLQELLLTKGLHRVRVKIIEKLISYEEENPHLEEAIASAKQAQATVESIDSVLQALSDLPPKEVEEKEKTANPKRSPRKTLASSSSSSRNVEENVDNDTVFSAQQFPGSGLRKALRKKTEKSEKPEKPATSARRERKKESPSTSSANNPENSVIINEESESEQVATVIVDEGSKSEAPVLLPLAAKSEIEEGILATTNLGDTQPGDSASLGKREPMPTLELDPELAATVVPLPN